MDKPYDTACTILHHMNCRDIHSCVFSHGANDRAAVENEAALAGVEAIARFLYGD